MFEKLVRVIFPDEGLEQRIQEMLEDFCPELYEEELTCVPEEIYYQITEVPMELPFDV